MKNEEQRIGIERNSMHQENSNIDQLAAKIDVLIFYKSLKSFVLTFNDMHSLCLDSRKNHHERMEDFFNLNSLLHSERGE
ncbi:hypothetical protein FKN04_22615 [Bacillus glycinifermentans]|uniref:hypothetical protein n=1 Tax=Bacillus glycinifermentans TaxID=1664069 RepID=UPI00158280CD|nr:hypothetical protein [Bacillus glycinifermentans]NUJ19329.1 hypothetical protein [Bacillus glycinifermentans]